MWSKFVEFLKTQPSVAMWAVNAVVAFAASFGLGAGAGWTAGASAIASALITIITALAARPVSIPLVTGAVATAVEAAAAAGWVHVSAHQLGLGIPVLSIILALALHEAITPLVTIRRREAWQPEHAVEVVQHVEHSGRFLSDEDLEALAGRLAQTIRRRSPQKM